MKHRWLFLAFAMLIASWCEHIVLTSIIGIVALVFPIRKFKKHLLFAFLLLSCLLRVSIVFDTQKPVDDVYVIQEVKSSYMVLKQGTRKVLAYGVENVHMDDVVRIQGTYRSIDAIHNFDSFYFPTWCERRGIYESIQVDAVEVLEEGKGVRHSLFCHIQNQDETKRVFLNQMLYGIHEDDVLFFVTSSGLHIITLVFLSKKLLTCFCSDRCADVIGFFCMGIIAYATVLSPTIIRMMCFQFVRFLFPNLERKDRLGVSILLVVWIAPYMAMELSLLIPVAFQMVYQFQKQKLPKKIQSFLVLAPLQFYFLHQVSLISMLFFQPLRMFFACCYVYAWMACFLPLPISQLSQCMQGLSSIIQSEPGIYYHTPIWWMLLYAMTLMRWITFHKRKDLIFLLLLFGFTQVGGYLDPFAKVYILDVGQGDCALIVYPFQEKVIMIDVMGSLYKDVAQDTIVPILHMYNIRKIDLLIVTHQDLDHSGGVETLSNQIPVKAIVDSKEKAKTLKMEGISFLGVAFEGSDENENSIVTLLQLFDTSMIFMGDAGYETEKELLKEYPNLNVDVLKAGHHGSKTSTSPRFLHQLHPSLTIMSAGRNNRYQHPSKEVLALLEKEGSHGVITAKNGAVCVQICKYFSFYRTADNEFGIIKHR